MQILNSETEELEYHYYQDENGLECLSQIIDNFDEQFGFIEYHKSASSYIADAETIETIEKWIEESCKADTLFNDLKSRMSKKDLEVYLYLLCSDVEDIIKEPAFRYEVLRRIEETIKLKEKLQGGRK